MRRILKWHTLLLMLVSLAALVLVLAPSALLLKAIPVTKSMKALVSPAALVLALAPWALSLRANC